MPLILPATKYSTIGYFIVIGLFQIIVLFIFENYFQFVIVVGGGGARMGRSHEEEEDEEEQEE